MKRTSLMIKLALFSAALLAITTSAASAGILSSPAPVVWGSGSSVSTTITDGSTGYVIGFSNNNTGDGTTWGATGTLDSDPNIEILERVTNNSGAPWTSFTVTVAPNDPFSTISNLLGLVPSNGGATAFFTTASAPVAVGTGESITFSGGTVPSLSTVRLDFSFDLSSTAFDSNSTSVPFTYAVSNIAATPEPASLSLLSAAALLLLKRRRTL